MQIKKTGTNSIEIKVDSTKILVNFGEYIKTEVVGENDKFVEKPGEYEYEGIYFSASEIVPAEGNFEAKINFLTISFKDSTSLAVIAKNIDLKALFEDKLTSKNILVTPVELEKNLEEIAKKLKPDVIISNSKFEKVENLKKEFQVDESQTTVKLDSGDFDSESDQPVRIYILN